MKHTTLLLTSMLFAILLPGCSKNGSGKKGPLPAKTVNGPVLNVSLEAAIDTLDQQTAVFATAFELIGNMVDGLMQMADDGSVKKAVCKDYTMSSDGLKYTFKLRDDVYWSNGDPVTAHDFVYGWQRAIDPATGSEYAFMISDIAQIKNATAIQAGQMDPNQLGVRAVDDYTFEVELQVPVSYFEQLLYFCTFYPANQKFVEKCGDKYATSPETCLANGAFVITEYSPTGRTISFKKNTAYYDAANVKLGGLHYEIISNGDEALRKYQSGQLDFVELSGEAVEKMKSSPEFTPVDSGFLYYLTFNFDDPMFANKNLRRAFTFAIDRERVITEMADGSAAAYSAIPRGYAFSSTGEDFTPKGIEFPDDCSYNIEKARAHLQQAKRELGVSKFNLQLLTADGETQVIASNSIKHQIEALFPEVNISIKAVPKTERRKIMSSGNFQFGLNNWGPDYADPMTYLAMWVTGNDNNQGNYFNPSYNALIASCTDGDLCTRIPERWAALKKAESMIMEDAVISPIYQKCNANLIKKNVRGIAFHAVAINRIYKNTTK
ncbi:oligopeptide transport system substrate-binding protein [Treponema rectale]|uniref:Oligopeptide transport system substrate-binding protein n=1 Tax=Treponema rectale TaxID=744512 RepID=A0A840SGM3_9SPIR|nr:peptide ABC transporter substrate-binding protein [Treponema rectale]MBB5218683.1 oligopeptide transport system substrate-binding protein [Treponema rectale]